MKYDKLTTPCGDCPFLQKFRAGFDIERLEEFASGPFGCHKFCDNHEDDDGNETSYIPNDDTPHCAGALIYLEKQGRSHNGMRIMERLGGYDHTKLNMDAPVRDPDDE